jgi:hypothetical protein
MSNKQAARWAVFLYQVYFRRPVARATLLLRCADMFVDNIIDMGLANKLN